jgi:fatty acid desaturase
MEQEQQQRYERVRARVKEIKGFYTHAAVFVLVNIGLFLINLQAGGGWWFFWPLLFWGIGLGVHAVNVFGFGGTLSRDWEERKTRELMDKEDR